MATTNIKLNFKDEQEGNIMRLIGFLTIIGSFVPGLVGYLALPDSLTKESKEVCAELANFNILGCIVLFICGIVPFIGWMISPLAILFFIIMNITFAIQILNNNEVKIPIILQLLRV